MKKSFLFFIFLVVGKTLFSMEHNAALVSAISEKAQVVNCLIEGFMPFQILKMGYSQDVLLKAKKHFIKHNLAVVPPPVFLKPSDQSKAALLLLRGFSKQKIRRRGFSLSDIQSAGTIVIEARALLNELLASQKEVPSMDLHLDCRKYSKDALDAAEKELVRIHRVCYSFFTIGEKSVVLFRRKGYTNSTIDLARTLVNQTQLVADAIRENRGRFDEQLSDEFGSFFGRAIRWGREFAEIRKKIILGKPVIRYHPAPLISAVVRVRDSRCNARLVSGNKRKKSAFVDGIKRKLKRIACPIFSSE